MSGRPSCPTPSPTPALNGQSANSEGGRIRNLMRACGGLNFKAETVPEKFCLCPPIQEIKPVITPAESSRLATAMIRCGTGTASGQVTQSRVKELLLTQGRANYGSEGVRIERLIQESENCLSNLATTNPAAQFNNSISSFAGLPEGYQSNIVVWFNGADSNSIQFQTGTSNLNRWYSVAGNTEVYGYPYNGSNPIPFDTGENGFFINNYQDTLYNPATASAIVLNSNIMPTSNFTVFTVSKCLSNSTDPVRQLIYDGAYLIDQSNIANRFILDHNSLNYLNTAYRENMNPLSYNFNTVCIAATSGPNEDILYENGAPVASNSTVLSFLQSVSTTVYPSMGGSVTSLDNRWMTGYMKQLLIYNIVLSPEQISTVTTSLLNGGTFESNVYTPSPTLLVGVPYACPPLPPPPAPPARACPLTKNQKYA